MRPLYPNWQKRIRIPDACYFATCTTRNFHLFFREPILCEIFTETLRQCKQNRNFELYGWSLGYDHFHSSIRPMGNDEISKIMHGLKRNASRNINFVMGFNVYDESLIENVDRHPHLRRGDGNDTPPISERADDNPHPFDIQKFIFFE
jgi:REP element-mobilizing transposase RayT